MAEMLIDGAKLDACNTAEADAIRAKTGGSSPIPYDYANNKGFADAIAAIPSSGGGIPTATVAIAQAVSTATGVYNALKDACVAELGDVPFIARFKSGNLPRYCLYELRYTPQNIADYFQTPTESTGTGAYVQMVRAPYDGYFNYKIALRESKMSNVNSFNIDANTVYEVIDISILYEGANV